MKLQKPPASFSVIKKNGMVIFVKETHRNAILNLLSCSAEFLRNEDAGDANKFGRGRYVSIPVAEDIQERLVIRHYRHGGLLGRFFGRIFYNKNRPVRELITSEHALRKGIPTAEAIGVVKKNFLGIFFKADFISKEVYGAMDVLQFLIESTSDYIQKSKRSIINEIAKVVRDMHDEGIYHADLHLKNILLKSPKSGENVYSVYIIDLDKSFICNHLAIDQRMKNLSRLNRSLEKIRWISARNGQNGTITSSKNFPDIAESSLYRKINLISRTDRIRFLKVYMAYKDSFPVDWRVYIRRYQSRHIVRKWWWSILDRPYKIFCSG